MSKRIVLSTTERGELVLRLLRKEAAAGELAREAGISYPVITDLQNVVMTSDPFSLLS